MTDIPTCFTSACGEHGIHLSEDQLLHLSKFVSEFITVNQGMNLSAIRDAKGIWMRHIFDSLLVASEIKADLNQRALDLGSGGGFPGIPLAIVRPDMEWVLVDSVSKKVNFLNETAQKLGLKNVTAISDRAEVLAHLPEHREQYHFVTARAVARLSVLLEYTIPFLRVNGTFVAMKGAQANQELKEARRAVERLSVILKRKQAQPGGGHLLIFKKRRSTLGKFPRGVGIPSQKSL